VDSTRNRRVRKQRDKAHTLIVIWSCCFACSDET
jgi:hypothetical protein